MLDSSQDALMVIVEITAHADLGFARTEADVLAWIELQGLEVSFGEHSHLLAFPQEIDGGEGVGPVVEVDLYPLDGGSATQVRWRLRGDALIESLQDHLQASPHWTTDGRWSSQPSKGRR